MSNAPALFIATPSPLARVNAPRPLSDSAARCSVVRMSHGPKVTRREFWALAVGASAAAAASALGGESAARAEGKTKRPEFVMDDSGVKYFDVKTGTGAGPVDGDFVVIDYLAFLSNGKIFDNRKGFVFQVGQRQVIPGLEAAVTTMRPGGQRKVVVPPKLAYGDKGVCLAEQNECLVPPGETLGFDVSLLRVAIPPT